ncbi:hypothetical protein ACG0Z6_04130 [Roseateles sp. BYS180W]|uniref:Type VI secretion system-associated protein TagF n=1 Tax=Roseateles rivi TaxID=3299028 RepID=A0ABW7FT39_9BURK
MRWLQRTLQHLTAQRLASPLAVWGKLPTHVDYVGLNASVAHAQAWQGWVARQWRSPALRRSEAPPRARAHAGAGWMHLDPEPQQQQDMTLAPVAFVLPALHAAPAQQLWWRGVMVTSSDRIGRPHPLIVYQQVSQRWLRRSVQDAGTEAALSAPLFALTRVLARWQAHHDDLASLGRSLAQLDHFWAPALPQLLGRALPPATDQQLHTIVQTLGVDGDAPDALEALDSQTPQGRRLRRLGVCRQAVGQPAAQASFWLFDRHGLCVRDAHAWPELWRSAS